MTITEFLLAQIAEDEMAIDGLVEVDYRPRIAADASGTRTRSKSSADLKARLVAECEAKRRIVQLHGRCDAHDRPGDECDACQRCGDGSIWPCDTLLAVASGYADRPDFREEWRA